MIHAILIIIHASIAFITFFLGILALRPTSNSGLPFFYRFYILSLGLLVLSLVVVVTVDWVHLGKEGQIVFGALTLFAIFIAWRGWRVSYRIHNHSGLWKMKYIDEIGFTLISLFVGFTMVFVLEIGRPIWEGVAIGVLAVVLGRIALINFKKKYQ